MIDLSIKKRAMYAGLAGWAVALIWAASCYLSTADAGCGLLPRLNLNNTASSLVFLPASLFLLCLSSFYSFKSQQAGDSSSDKFSFGIKVSAVFIAVAAFIMPAFNTHDISFYFSSGQFINANRHIYNAVWPQLNYFTCPHLLEGLVDGYMYGPLIAGLVGLMVTLAAGSFLKFYLMWKLLIVAAISLCVYLTIKIANEIDSEKTYAQGENLAWLWLLQPIIIWEWLANGHFDAFWLVFLLAAILYAIRRRWLLVFAFLAIGAWLKFLPLLMLPWFLLWWWQGTEKKQLIPELSKLLGAGIVFALITIAAWLPYWQGKSTLSPIILQAKWAVYSIFAVTYFALKPAFVYVFAGSAHWYLTRILQAALLAVVAYLLYPLLIRVVNVLAKRSAWRPLDYIIAIFASFFVYLAIWQKSFWPWYASWLLPLGFIILAKTNSKILTRLLVSLSICPLAFYVLWIFDHLLKLGLVDGLAFQTVSVILTFSLSLAFFWFWRKENFSLPSQAALDISLKQTAAYLLRQAYRVVMIWPYELIISIIHIAAKFFGQTGDDKKKASIFIISSVIYAPEDLAYNGQNRSAFSPEERISQTIQTIESIRKYSPDSYIVLIEGGTKDQLPEDLSGAADQYLYLGKMRLVRWACDSRFKGLGEAVMLISAIKRIDACSERYFKISGRYLLNEKFQGNDWDKEKFTFLELRPRFFSTRLYGIGGKRLLDWKFALLKSLPFLLIDYPIEHTLEKFIDKRHIDLTGSLGVEGSGGSCRTIINE